MLTKVYMVKASYRGAAGLGNLLVLHHCVFYVRATGEDEAMEKAREAVSRFLFKKKLANSEQEIYFGMSRIADDVIAEDCIAEAFLLAELKATDMTAQAYLWSKQRKPLWEDWIISEEAALA